MFEKFVDKQGEFDMKTLGKQFIGSFLLLLFCGLFVFAQTEKQIDAIKRIYKETNEKVAECEENGEYSSTFLSEMVVNKNNGSYPAVGTFKSVFKFYYTYGNREKNPYPNRLLKIIIETKRAANSEKYEYLFNEKENLVFYFEKKEDTEFRVYYSNEKPIKFLKGTQEMPLSDKNINEKVKNSLTEKKKLVNIFFNSFDY